MRLDTGMKEPPRPATTTQAQNDKTRTSGAPSRPNLPSRPQLTSSRRSNVPSRMSQTMLASPSPPAQASPKPEPSVSLARTESEESVPPMSSSTPTSPMDLAMLREAVNRIQSKSFTRVASTKSGPPSPASPKPSMRKTVLAGGTTESSTQQQNLSPSLEASFSSPLPTGELTAQSTSTESTGSARTVRASAAPTPFGYPARTPSYPFPYVPGLHGHEPFTALSPTVSSDPHAQHYSTDRYSASSRSTPLGAPSFFGPASAAAPPTEGGVPMPNLYDVVLQLNAEPTLAAWWSTLTTVLREQYRVDRASISIPADATDIENVPWGQKASYNVAGLKDLMSADARSTRSGSTAESNSSSSGKADSQARSYTNSRLTAMRPTLEMRHSFAGYEMGRGTTSTAEPRFPSPTPRPGFSRRTTSHVSTTRVPSWTEPTPVPDIPTSNPNTDLPSRFDNADDTENESSTLVVLQTLRALDKERDPLLDSSGVNRIVKRSRLVILTRDYTTTPSQAPREPVKSPALPIPEEEEEETNTQVRSEACASYSSQASLVGRRKSTSRFYQGANYRTATGRLQQGLGYEEYEQFPSSPWAQSPAPSPAIQKDDDHNPFFATGGLVEETFSPAQVNEDYTKFGQVEAIGVDKASTIIHVPLVHPLLSQTVRTEPDYVGDVNIGHSRRRSRIATESAVLECKAPIAILSILSPDVPFPQKLQESLKHIAPHLATSFQTSLQNTTLQERVAGAIHRNQKSGRAAPGSLAISGNRVGLGLGLESLLQFETDDTVSSTVGSIASPSEFSSGTRNSPPGSNFGTPSFDPNAHFASGRHAGSTPGLAPEGSDSYFDHKERQPLVRAKSGMALTQASPTVQLPSRPSSDHRNVLRKTETSPSNRDHSSDSRKDGKRPRRKDDSAPSAHTSPNARRNISTHPIIQDDAKHTYLHSRGADFNASFQSLPMATMPQPTTAQDQARTSRASEAQDMPPPSERLLRTIIDSLPVQIFTAAPLTGRVTWVNSKFLVYRGQTSQQVLDDPWETIHREDLAAYTEDWNRSLHTGQQFQHKIRLRRFDDFYRWYYVRAAPLRDKMQNIVHWVGTMIDLHDQHIAEVNAAQQQETAASEAKYRALANSSPQIVFAATKAKGVSFCNTQWVQYSGQTEEQAKGTGFMEHVFPDDLIKCKLPDFDETGEHASNVPITVAAPKRAKSGSPGSGDSSDPDMTPIQSGVIMSPGGMQQSQRKLSELASTGITLVNKDSTGRPSYSTEVRLRGKNGEYRWHLVRVLLAEPVRNADSQEDTWYGTCTDINDHKELEQTLKETMDAKSRFLSNMSHEIRTPLNGIHGMASFLIDSNLTAEQLDHVNVIRASTEGLRDLINDILDLSKVEAGMITLDYKWLHIRSVIEEVNDLTSSLALDKGLELNYYVDDQVPSMIKGDKFRFRQILLNVIGNAIKFTQQGEVLIRCTLYKDDDQPVPNTSMLKFEVIDTGHGFNEKEAEKLFKRFSQIDGSSTRQHGGTGLGLVISMQLVELHGGHMTASSVVGKGSTFTFTMRFNLPTETDRPGVMPPNNSVIKEKQMPIDMGWPGQKSAGPKEAGETGMANVSLSPDFYAGLETHPQDTPVSSAGSSNPSIMVSQASLSPMSSANTTPGSPIELELPAAETERRHHEKDEDESLRQLSKKDSIKPGVTVKARIYSVLVVCPLRWTREAITGHLNSVLDHIVPHTIASRATLDEARPMLQGPESFRFTHVILSLPKGEEVVSLYEIVQKLPSPIPSVVVVTDTTQRKDLIARNTQFDFEKLNKERRLRFVQKPVKPSRLAPIFDPEKSRELSTDQNQTSAQQIALSQKRVFDEMTRRLGNKDIKVLLVEDNRINQMVMLKLLKRVSVAVETCFDGVQATDKVLGKPAGYFSIILLDLMMPNKDGYQTCRDIRAWERKNNHPPIPIVALSANVLDDVWQKCGEAGFNSYLTKPVEFKELSDVMTQYLDPKDPATPMEYMQYERRESAGGKR